MRNILRYARVQRESEVIHVITDRLEDLTPLLRQVADRDDLVPLPTGCGDGARHGGSPDVREPLRGARDIYCPERTSIKPAATP